MNTGHEFLNINMILSKHIQYMGIIMNIWENFHIHKHKINDKLIDEQIQ